MSATVAMVRARAPEFATVVDADVQVFLDSAALQMNASAWGARADLGQTYLAAHELAIARPDLAGAAGPVQSESVGQVSVAYAVAQPGATAGEYSGSRFGVEYMRLVRQLGLGLQVL
jgi:hypothetical protein